MTPPDRVAIKSSAHWPAAAGKTGAAGATAGRAVDAAVKVIKTSLKKGGNVTLVGFGTFHVSKRAARMGRNPRTGAEIKIRAAKVPKFKPGKALRDSLN